MIRTILCSNFKESTKVFGFEDEKNQIMSKITSTFQNGESNSFMIIGKSGCGKTKLINSVLYELTINKKFQENMVLVKLDGKIQNDDKIALKSISRQVKINLEEDDEVTNESFNKAFQYILDMLKSGHKECARILFIIENFEFYLHQKSQMLAYNILNSVQLNGTPVFVLLTTPRLDITELMEKRVKSRFSHHKIILECYTSKLQNYIEVASYLLKVRKPNYSKGISRKASSLHLSTFNSWNKHVDDFIKMDNVVKILENAYYVSETIGDLKKLLIPLIVMLPDKNPKLDYNRLEDSWKTINFDSKFEIIKNLSDHQFLLLVVIFKFSTLHDNDMNFEKIYKEYQQFCLDYRRKCLSKLNLFKSLDEMKNLQLISLDSSSSITNLPFNYHSLSCNVSLQSLQDVFIQNPNIDSALVNYFNTKVTV